MYRKTSQRGVVSQAKTLQRDPSTVCFVELGDIHWPKHAEQEGSLHQDFLDSFVSEFFDIGD
jgi:hypothetical protein